jgi:ribose-phosphate pyrophosphokinase
MEEDPLFFPSTGVSWLSVGDFRWVGPAIGFSPEDLRLRPVAVGAYPDREPRIDLRVSPTRRVILTGKFHTLDGQVDASCLFGFLAAACALRQHGAERIVALVAEIPYARQDRPTAGTRELAAADWAAQLLDGSDIDAVVTWHTKSDFPSRLRRTTLIAPPEPALAEAIATAVKTGPLVVGTVVAPDRGAASLARAVAQALGCRELILDKERIGPSDAHVSSAADLNRKVPAEGCLIVDDMVVSGGTLMACVAALAGTFGGVVAYISNFRPSGLGRRRLDRLYQSRQLSGLLVPRYWCADSRAPFLLPGVDTSTDLREALRQAVECTASG